MGVSFTAMRICALGIALADFPEKQQSAVQPTDKPSTLAGGQAVRQADRQAMKQESLTFLPVERLSSLFWRIGAGVLSRLLEPSK